MKSGCSAPTLTGSCVASAASSASCHQTSRPSVHGVSWPVRRMTRTLVTDVSPWLSASSTDGFSAEG